MTSKITIEIDFDTAIPYIRVIPDRNSDDVRDKLVNEFKQKLGASSQWCRVRFDDTGISGRPIFTIEPLQPSDLPQELKFIEDVVFKRVPMPLPMVNHAFGDDVKEPQFKEMIFQRNVLNPYSEDSQSHTAYDKGFEECYYKFSKAEKNIGNS